MKYISPVHLPGGLSHRAPGDTEIVPLLQFHGQLIVRKKPGESEKGGKQSYRGLQREGEGGVGGCESQL